MTTKPSDAPWADAPFPLLTTPSRLEKYKDEKHSFLHTACEMTHVHNVLIRGLNSFYQQAPYVKTHTEPGYKEKDVKDLLAYVTAWVKMVEHHHDTEEAFIFPEIEQLSGKPGFMGVATEQHEAFHGGLERLLAFAESTKPADFKWVGGMKEVVDSFSEALMDHLTKEIDLFLSMGSLDSEGLRKAWDKGEANATKQTNLALLRVVFPCVLGNADKTYEDSAHDFPPLPKVLPYVVKYGFAAGNGAWRFAPCDFWGQPRPLAFGPDRQG
ncbi:hypothetical protein N0V93_002205 [Gnomoniopsis smithogilvyi]|uniref:Hemerythrin-like domain-containing protein n=1 Tax=Gnomoniopsis smithogilvyi TaxID=1191159 RepID=A0A9W8YW97_9PEZI|nr:hypothetical protein N0V93_002205 [Gnomoniopsis smithogilvyi]